jgi:hypothetical protein
MKRLRINEREKGDRVREVGRRGDQRRTDKREMR